MITLHFSCYYVKYKSNFRFYHILSLLLQINVEVDTNITQTGTIVGEFTILSSRVLYVGGSPSPGTVGDVRIVDNFRGCLKQVGTN